MLALVEFKKQLGVDTLNLMESKNNKKYVVTPAGECIMLSKDCDISKEMYVINHTDKETGESWRFISNTTPGKVVGTI